MFPASAAIPRSGMLDLVHAFIDSDLWIATQAVAAAVGVVGLCGLLLGHREGVWPRVVVWGGIGFLVCSILFSVLFEEILPQLDTMPRWRWLPYGLGLAGMLLATVLIVLGGRRFVRDTLSAMRGAPSGGSDRAGGIPLKVLLRAWGPGLLRIAGGFLLFVLSASAYHADHFPLPWLWALAGRG